MTTTTRPSVAVIVCAYTLDRLDDLTACIDSLHAQSIAADELVVVVDHNELLAATLRTLASERSWSIEVVESSEPQGLSGARNTGIAVTSSELALFIDDDAIADSTWLDELVAPFADPTTSAAGGRIDPGWPDARPAWFPPHLDWTVGCSIPTLPTDGGPIRNMYGASAAFRRTALEAIGGFPTELGRVGANGAGCEETEICIRIRQQSETAQVLYAPQSRVTHRVTTATRHRGLRPASVSGRGAVQGDPQPTRRRERSHQRRARLRAGDRQGGGQRPPRRGADAVSSRARPRPRGGLVLGIDRLRNRTDPAPMTELSTRSSDRSSRRTAPFAFVVDGAMSHSRSSAVPPR